MAAFNTNLHSHQSFSKLETIRHLWYLNFLFSLMQTYGILSLSSQNLIKLKTRKQLQHFNLLIPLSLSVPFQLQIWANTFIFKLSVLYKTLGMKTITIFQLSHPSKHTFSNAEIDELWHLSTQTSIYTSTFQSSWHKTYYQSTVNLLAAPKTPEGGWTVAGRFRV